MERIDLQELSRRTGVSEAKLQFCLDNDLTWRDWLMPEFADYYPNLVDMTTGIYATLAARLSEIGCTIDGIKWLMKGITTVLPQRRNPLNLPILADVITGSMPAFVQVGDGRLVKWMINHRSEGWFKFHPTVERDDNADPEVVVAINVAQIRDAVRRSSIA